MTVDLSNSDAIFAAQLAAEAGVSVPEFIGGLLRWTAVLHSRQIRDDELPEHPADADPQEKPALSRAADDLRRECGLYLTAVNTGHTKDGPLWVWQAWTGDDVELPVVIEHDPRSLNQGLLLFLTGYRLGMKVIPF